MIERAARTYSLNPRKPHALWIPAGVGHQPSTMVRIVLKANVRVSAGVHRLLSKRNGCLF